MAAARSAAGSLTAAALTVLVAGAIAAGAAAQSLAAGEGAAAAEVVITLAATGTVLLLAAFAFRRPGSIGWGVALLAAAYIVTVIDRGAGIDPTAPLFGLGLLLAAELAYTACELRGPHATDPAGELHRWALLTLVGGGGALVGAAAMVVAAHLPGSVAGLLSGSAAAVALVAVAAWLRHRGALG